MQAYKEAEKVVKGLVDGSVCVPSLFAHANKGLLTHPQIPLEATTLDAAKSSIVYSVTRGVSTAGRAVSDVHNHVYHRVLNCLLCGQAIASFINQALKGVSQNWNVELLEKYHAVTKEDVIASLKKHVLPVFDPSSSVAIVVTAPSKADSIGEGLSGVGFEVDRRTLEIDPEELEGSESGSESGSSESIPGKL